MVSKTKTSKPSSAPPLAGNTTTSPSPSSNVQQASSLLNYPMQLASSLGWGPLVSLSRSSVCSLFIRLQVGLLTIHDADGTTLHFGEESLKAAADNQDEGTSSSSSSSSSVGSVYLDSEKPIRATLDVKRDEFWVRMFFGADLGFSEAYMAGEVETPDLGDCFDLFIHNREALSELDLGLASRLTGWVQGQLNKRYANTKGGSLKNIGAHYDISNAMYERFLSRDMTYSCGIFPTLDADIAPPVPLAAASTLSRGNSDSRAKPANQSTKMTTTSKASSDPTAKQQQRSRDSGLGSPTSMLSNHSRSPNGESLDELEDAQIRKLRLHITRCQISPGDRVLEIGTGWGSLAMETCKMIPDVTIDTLTLSKEQKSLAEARIAAAGLEKQITVHLMDYRDMPAEWNNSFDRVVSIEMLEAVGIEFLSTYFSCIHKVLKMDIGTAVFQCITMPESRFDAYVRGVDFIKKYIFPGGVLPSVTSLVQAMTDGSKGTMVLQGCDSIGPHYARTLREWKRKFEECFYDEAGGIREALLRDHPNIARLPAGKREEEVEVFRRKWLYYFIYCERGFAENQIGDHILTFARVGAPKQPISFGV